MYQQCRHSLTRVAWSGNAASQSAYADCLNPPFIHSTTFIVSDDWKIGCGTPFRIAMKHGIVFTPQ